jgi:putative transposase
MHNNDGKYTKLSLSALRKAKIKTYRTAIRSPNTVALVERVVQSIKQECLDHFIVFGHKHMNVLCSQFRDHYHLERPHQGKDNGLLHQPKLPQKAMRPK